LLFAILASEMLRVWSGLKIFQNWSADSKLDTETTDLAQIYFLSL
jgi:hypothetical protein